MNDADFDYEAHIEDIIKSLHNLSRFISKSSENKSHAERAIEILNITSQTIRKSQNEPQLVLQELINSLYHLSNLYTSKKTTKLILICLEKLMLLTKTVPINSPSTHSILNLLKKKIIEVEKDSILFLKILQILQSLASPSSLFFSEISLFKQYFALLCEIYKKSENSKSSEIITAAFENLLLQLVFLYRTKNDCLVYKSIFHSLLSDFISLLGGKDIVFIDMPKSKAFNLILLITDNLVDSCVTVDFTANDLFLELLLLYEYLNDDREIAAQYPPLALKFFKFLGNISIKFVAEIIDLSNRLKANGAIIFLLFCLLSANHPNLELNGSASLLLNHFVNKLSSIKFDLSELHIASFDVFTCVNDIPTTCLNVAKEMEGEAICSLENHIPTICLQGVLAILLKYRKFSNFLENGKFIFQIFLSHDNSTNLAYSSLELLFLISLENYYIFEFVCNRALYDKKSVYPLSCMFSIFNKLNSPEKRSVDLFIRTLVRVIYSLLESCDDVSIEKLENVVNESIFGAQINEFITSLGAHPFKPQIIEVLNECLTDSVLFKKRFGTEVYLYLLKFAPLEDLLYSVKLLGPECEKYYECITEKFVNDIIYRIDMSTSSPLLSDDDWESLTKLSFSPFIYDILVKLLESKLDYLDNKEWNCIIEILSKFTSGCVSHVIGSGKIISLLEQIVDNSDFGTQYMNESFFQCITNCSKLCELDSQYGVLSADNEGFRCVGLIWKVADLIGRDGIISDVLWWSVLSPLIETSKHGSLAVKICAIRSLTTTLVTYWKLFTSCLDKFFTEWTIVIKAAKDNDELVDRESLFTVSIHETMEIINSVEFDSMNSFFSRFIEIVSDSCEVNFFQQFAKFALSNDIIAKFGRSDLYNNVIDKFLLRVSLSLGSQDALCCADTALRMYNDDPYNMLLCLAYLVPLLYTPIDSDVLLTYDVSDVNYWIILLEQLCVDIDHSIVIEMSPAINKAISDLDTCDAVQYIVDMYKINAKGAYKVTCDTPIRKASQFLASLPIDLPEYNKILDITCKRLGPVLVDECLLSNFMPTPVFTSLISNLVQSDTDPLISLFCVDRISCLIRNLGSCTPPLAKSGSDETEEPRDVIPRSIASDSKTGVYPEAGILPAPCYGSFGNASDFGVYPEERRRAFTGGAFELFNIISRMAKSASGDRESVVLHLVLINLMEDLLEGQLDDDSSIYIALDAYMDNPNSEFHVVLQRLFKDSQDPKASRGALVTLVKRLNKCLDNDDIAPIRSIMPMIGEHKVESPRSIGLTAPIFETLKPHCILICILTSLYKAKQRQVVVNEVERLYESAIELIITKVMGSLEGEQLWE